MLVAVDHSSQSAFAAFPPQIVISTINVNNSTQHSSQTFMHTQRNLSPLHSSVNTTMKISFLCCGSFCVCFVFSSVNLRTEQKHTHFKYWISSSIDLEGSSSPLCVTQSYTSLLFIYVFFALKNTQVKQNVSKITHSAEPSTSFSSRSTQAMHMLALL